ncbi:hypothetical protein JX266_004244 [Neoarthrinium moseri]|uniref:uncharacterized protein n=1 Tax=Neoarthrinium moseri TaxID=1658444 RepID=UPI001FDCA8A0|nr:uncharacterized protein JN550_007592 [Neoarthrinium moseri]KAI1850386.1 hypothetical protein JX266_004244 [Neoarthrinium moseri]KAI1866739.1 hypothetical protein JN550_007592 [Neoarthrinium moseri]
MSLQRLLGMGLSTAAMSFAAAAWPNGPLATSGRWIKDASGSTVTYAGVNWPGHVDTMIPEGLQYQSVETIVSKIKSIGINSIRLTYAIEMIDQIENNGGNDIPIRTAFTNALGQDNGTAIYEKVMTNNPAFGDETTRLQVFDAIATECHKQEIYVHLDNHVSKAGWCCSPLDGNTWWGDTYFSTANWTRGLSYMADHGKQWPNLMSMSLRNELRQPLLNKELYSDSYNWEDWYKYTKQGADAIHSANSDVLIFLSGLDSDTTLQPVVENTALTPGSSTFQRADFNGYGDKLVLELHNYANILGGSEATNCTALQGDLSDDGFKALATDAPNQFPVVMTEYGFEQDSTTPQDAFASCIEEYLADQQAGWMIWALSGSYYIREGTQDGDEPWGLLTHDWSDWRSPEYVEGKLTPLVKSTLAVNGTDQSSSVGQDGGSSGNGTSGDSGAQSGPRAGDVQTSVLLALIVGLAMTCILA